jgi:hypothetical protein
MLKRIRRNQRGHLLGQGACLFEGTVAYYATDRQPHSEDKEKNDCQGNSSLV